MSEAVTPEGRELVVERGGSNVHGWVHGAGEAHLVVLLHGAAMDHRLFEAQVGPLVEAGYRVLTVDFRGHGQSKPLGEGFTVPDLADDVLALVDDLDAGVFSVVGQSLGGYVAQDLVARNPERVTAIGIIGATCTTMPVKWWEMLALRSSPLWFKLWPERHLRRTVAKSTAVTPEARAYAFRAMNQLSKDEFVTVWRAVARAVQPKEGYRIEHPLLLTHGDADDTGNIRKTAPAWADRDPQCRYEVIPDAGHNANQDNPEVFNRILLAFLAEHAPASAPGGTKP